MRVNEIERALSAIPPHPAPRADLEQYATPADVAAPLLFEAHALRDIEGRRVVDLGCGTGILGIGAALLGAVDVVGVDVDTASLDVARRFAAALGVSVAFEAADVASWSGASDTVVMNPPFGAQRPGADRVFLETAFKTAPVVYSMHNASTKAFVERFAGAHGFAATHRWAMRVSLAHQYRHQSRAKVEVDVLAFRFTKTS